MKIGLVGFSGSGKSVAFRWLTGVTPDPAKIQQGQTGMAKVPDPRLEANQSPQSLGLKPDEEKLIRSFQLLTIKPELVLVNQGDAAVGKPLPADLLALAPGAIAAPVKLELELEELGPEDRAAFMADL